jgi:hypothetical protein
VETSMWLCECTVIHSMWIIVPIRKKSFIRQNGISGCWQMTRNIAVMWILRFHCSFYCHMWKCGVIQHQYCGKLIQELCTKYEERRVHFPALKYICYNLILDTWVDIQFLLSKAWVKEVKVAAYNSTSTGWFPSAVKI